MRYLLFLLLPIFTQGQAVYDPAEKLVKMPIDMAVQLDSLARLGKVCSQSVNEAELQLQELIKNNEYNTKIVQSMQASIMFAQHSLGLLEQEIVDLQIDNSTLSRKAAIYKSETDRLNKEIKRDMWGKAIVGGSIVAIAVAVVVNSLTPRR